MPQPTKSLLHFLPTKSKWPSTTRTRKEALQEFYNPGSVTISETNSSSSKREAAGLSKRIVDSIMEIPLQEKSITSFNRHSDDQSVEATISIGSSDSSTTISIHNHLQNHHQPPPTEAQIVVWKNLLIWEGGDDDEDSRHESAPDFKRNLSDNLKKRIWINEKNKKKGRKQQRQKKDLNSDSSTSSSSSSSSESSSEGSISELTDQKSQKSLLSLLSSKGGATKTTTTSSKPSVTANPKKNYFKDLTQKAWITNIMTKGKGKDNDQQEEEDFDSTNVCFCSLKSTKLLCMF
jgi:hypothetical protein